ncbi:MAG: hypothetical protein LBU60_01795 [Clostridiales bacterium]|jgi:putative aldouronate transport system substrate-binding protein|nr:hypothetical protein [Clostridiales bacterium]
MTLSKIAIVLSLLLFGVFLVSCGPSKKEDPTTAGFIARMNKGDTNLSTRLNFLSGIAGREVTLADTSKSDDFGDWKIPTPRVDLKVAAMNNQAGRIKFTQSSIAGLYEYGDPSVSKLNSEIDGRSRPGQPSGDIRGTYDTNRIKPVWEDVEYFLNAKVTDMSGDSAKNVTEQWNELSQKLNTVDVINASPANIIANKNNFLNLAEHLDKMPNFRKFLNENKFVQEQISGPNGEIYYTPYFDGKNELDRMFQLRADWVVDLLDGGTVDSDFAGNDSKHAFTQTSFTAFLPESIDRELTITKFDGSNTEKVKVNQTKNIITMQNELIASSDADAQGLGLVNQFKKYIDQTYLKPNGSTSYYDADQRSDLFIGANAAYNADELVALMRIVRANTGYLLRTKNGVSGRRSGLPSSWATAPIVPFFSRSSSNDRSLDMFRFATIWGARGLESRDPGYFWDNEGKLKDGRIDPNTLNALLRMNQLYSEGLILNEYNRSDTMNWATNGLSIGGIADEHRARLFSNNLGFMTYDFSQTTLVFNDDSIDANWAAKKIDGFEIRPVIPPFTSWDNAGNVSVADMGEPHVGTNLTSTQVNAERGLTRFTDSWRGVKNDAAWAIVKQGNSAVSATQLRAIQLFDFMFSDRGVQLMSFGPNEWLQWESKQGDGDWVEVGKESLKSMPWNSLENLTFKNEQGIHVGDTDYRIRTFDYSGSKWPVVGDLAQSQIIGKAQGNYTNYYRIFLGGTFPIGYVKEQAMEIQYTSGWDKETGKINVGLQNMFWALGKTDGSTDAKRTFEFAAQMPVSGVGVNGQKQNRAVNTTWPLTDSDVTYFNNTAMFGGITQKFPTQSTEDDAGGSMHVFHVFIRLGRTTA